MMAVNKRCRSYKLTPRRKAAILKAQAASARKRRGRIGRVARTVGVVAVTGAAAGLAYKSMRKSRNKSTVVKELDILRIAPRVSESTGAMFWANVGQPLNTRKITVKPRRKRLNYVESEKKRLRELRRKELKNYKARRKYWGAKPVPKVRRKR